VQKSEPVVKDGERRVKIGLRQPEFPANAMWRGDGNPLAGLVLTQEIAVLAAGGIVVEVGRTAIQGIGRLNDRRAEGLLPAAHPAAAGGAGIDLVVEIRFDGGAGGGERGEERGQRDERSNKSGMFHGSELFRGQGLKKLGQGSWSSS
jgi:hypothetical protein